MCHLPSLLESAKFQARIGMDALFAPESEEVLLKQNDSEILPSSLDAIFELGFINEPLRSGQRSRLGFFT